MKALNDELQMRSDWLLPICAGGERVKTDGVKAHPTQKPEALLYRVLLACTNKGDVVLDPFFGTGTTGAVARRLGRDWIGIERESRYIEVARERIDSTLALDESAMKTMASRATQPKVPFGALVESGHDRAGRDAHRREAALERAGAAPTPRSSMAAQQGSIHKIGAAVQGAPACNGWTFWHVERDGALVPLDALRQDYLACARLTSAGRLMADRNLSPPDRLRRCAVRP